MNDMTGSNKPKVLLSRAWPDAVEAELARDFEVTLNTMDTPMTPKDFAEAFAVFDAVMPTVTDTLNAEAFAVEAPRTRLLANYGVGFSHIDLDSARACGMTVTNTPDVLSECTADLTLTLMLMLARRACEGERELRAGGWSGWRPTHMIGTKMSGKSLGIIGYGRIGQEVAKRAHSGFGMKVKVYNRSPVAPEVLAQVNAQQVPLDSLLGASEFVSLHCPGGDANRHLIGETELTVMQPGAMLINTARGEVIDESALVKSLEEGTLGGAGLDVFDDEPNINPALMNCKNLVMLPHLGSATLETREAMGRRALDNLKDFFAGRTPRDQVA